MVEFKYEGELAPRIIEESINYYKENYGIPAFYGRGNMFVTFANMKKLQRLCESGGVAVSDYDAMIDVLADEVMDNLNNGVKIEFDAGEYNFYMSPRIVIIIVDTAFIGNVDAQVDIVEGGDTWNDKLQCLNEIVIYVNKDRMFCVGNAKRALTHELNHVAEHFGRMTQSSGVTGMGSYYYEVDPNFGKDNPNSIMVNLKEVNNSPYLDEDYFKAHDSTNSVEGLLFSFVKCCYYVLADTEKNAFSAEIYSDLRTMNSVRENIYNDVKKTEIYNQLYWIQQTHYQRLNSNENKEFWIYAMNTYLDGLDVNDNNWKRYRKLVLRKIKAKTEKAMNRLFSIALTYYNKKK